MSFEVRLRHRESAHALFESGLDVLAHADDDVWMLAVELTTLLASQETEALRPAAAIAIYERTMEACSRATRVEARLRLHVSLGRLQLTASDAASALVTAEAGLAIAADLSAVLSQDPYRETERHQTTPRSVAIRASMVTLVELRIAALAKVGRFAEAEDASRLASSLLPGGLSEDESKQIGLSLAFVAFRAGNYRAAERLYGGVIGDGEPEGLALDALASLGWAYLRLGLVDEAAGVAKRIMQKDSTSTRAGALRSAAELARGRLDDAESFARQAAAHESDRLSCAAALRVIAEVELARGNHGPALVAAESALEHMRAVAGANDQYTSDQLVTLARVEAAMQRPTAESRFQAALALDMPEDHPRRAVIQDAYADHLAAVGRVPEAETLRARAKSITALRLHQSPTSDSSPPRSRNQLS